MSEQVDIPQYAMSGERARLIPVGPDSQKERKAVSVLLASLHAVEEFGKGLLSSIGAKASKKSAVTCFTEVTVADEKADTALRPDGLITVTYGQRLWGALVEAKVGSEQHNSTQIEGYLDLARERGLDAVITISNQFSPDPSHSPISVHGSKLRSVALYHWSWRYLISRAQLAEKNKEISDPDQAFILAELVRYLAHESSGVRSFSSMGPSWKQTCLDVQHGKRLLKDAPGTTDAIVHWLQLARFLSLEISLAVGKTVSVSLTPKQRRDPNALFSATLDELTGSGTLSAGFEIPNAASTLWLKLDLQRRNLSASMAVDAPGDKKQPKAAVTWLTRQLGDPTKPDEVLLHAFWPYRSEPGVARLSEVQARPEAILDLNPDGMPKRFEVAWITDLAADVARSRVFVDAAERLVLDFYRELGQNLKPWVASPPKVQDGKPEATEEASESSRPSLDPGGPDPSSNPGAVTEPAHDPLP